MPLYKTIASLKYVTPKCRTDKQTIKSSVLFYIHHQTSLCFIFNYNWLLLCSCFISLYLCLLSSFFANQFKKSLCETFATGRVGYDFKHSEWVTECTGWGLDKYWSYLPLRNSVFKNIILSSFTAVSQAFKCFFYTENFILKLMGFSFNALKFTNKKVK